jgi:dUTP pyrophosphatase
MHRHGGTLVTERLEIVFEALHDDVDPPIRQTAHSAGYDLHAYLRARTVTLVRGATGEEVPVTADGALRLDPGDVALVPTGFRARVPPGYEAQVRMRSSMAFRRGLILPNAPGTIDSDYPDEWLIMMKNDSPRPVVIAHGERIAQVVISPHVAPAWVAGSVRPSTDRIGGFGSTGSA